jgi:hypothetical protein
MRILLLSVLLSTLVLSAEDSVASGKKLWKVSLVSLAAANTLDITSSWGKRELNTALANPAGRFGTQGALIKLGLQGGLFGIEYLIARGHPAKRTYRVLSVINFGAAASFGAVAARNYGIPAPPR